MCTSCETQPIESPDAPYTACPVLAHQIATMVLDLADPGDTFYPSCDRAPQGRHNRTHAEKGWRTRRHERKKAA